MSGHLILEILVHVMNCTQYMHDRGVVHRDLKPENLFLVQRADDPYFAKVLDLGIAQVSGTIATGPGTQAGAVMGTPIYMAPEQLRGERVTALADIFALGVITYEMLTGGWFPWQQDHESRAAYLALPETELYHRQRSTPPFDPRRRFRGITEGWARVVLRAIDPDPRNRPESARGLARLLAEQTPDDGIHQSGFEIIKQRAKELLRTNEGSETIRAPRPPAAPPAQAPGNRLRYQLGAKLGAGGMAEVFDGTLLGAEGFERRVAIKRVLTGLSEVPGFMTMFVAEAQIASRLNHTNVVSVFDFDRDADGQLYLVMEYVHGKDLARFLEAGPIAPSLAIYIATELLRGLGYAHAPEPNRDGIVHRDVSPQNLLLSYEGAVKVSDFGLAKARDGSGNARSTTVRGKPSYMSPEQCNGEALDARSDLFAVGVMLWEMVTHRSLFTGTPREIIAQVLFMDIPLPSSVRSRVPADLEAITMKLLARVPSDRYPNAEAVIAELLRCVAAPRDGRGELVHLLAQRFPDSAMRTRLGGSGAGHTQLAGARPRSTLASTASQSVPRVRWARRWSLAVGLGATVALGTLLGLFALGTGHLAATLDAGTPEPVAAAAMPDASPRIAAPDVRDASPPPPTAAPSFSDRKPRNELRAPIDAKAPVARDAATRGAQRAPAATAVLERIPQVAAVQRTGELAILVRPWAVIWLNGKSLGQTPYRETIPVGRYRLRIQNDELGKDETTTVTITPDQTTTIERKW